MDWQIHGFFLDFQFFIDDILASFLTVAVTTLDWTCLSILTSDFDCGI